MTKLNIRKNGFLYILILALIFLILIAVFADVIAPFDPYEGSLRGAFKPPDDVNFFGTDKLGRDIFSRILYGVRISLSISLALILIILIFGAIFGIIAGYVGGVADILIMRVCDILISCPSMVLAIALAGIMGASVRNAMIAIFIVSISKYVRLSRSLVIQIINQEYIKSAKMSGTKNVFILTRHVIPNIAKPLIVTASTDIGSIILELSALSFLGVGIPAPLPELGFLINDARAYMLQSPWMIFFPALFIFIIVSTFNLLSDKLSDLIK